MAGVREEEEELEDDVIALVVIREGEAEVVRNPNDDELAEAVQMQEILFSCLQPRLVPVETPPGTEELIDLKGKQTALLPLSYSVVAAERGECSSSRVVRDMFTCPICMEAVRLEDGFTVNPCGHAFCVGCTVRYVTVKAEESAVSVPCPAVSCDTAAIDPATCQRFLSKDTFDKWCVALCELSLGVKKFYCPFKDCSALLVDEGGETVLNSECPHCNRMFCARCGVPWHSDMSCEEFKGLGEDEKGREDLMLRNLANDKRWQRCPECRMYVEKIDGCMFMKCRCAYCFCYACASPMSIETHYCAKCQR